MSEVSLPVLLALAAVAFFAGVVDAIAGGGGLLTLPALLAAGLDPHIALGTNKGQSVFGTVASLFRYARAGLVDRNQAKLSFPAGFVGALGGAALLLALDPTVLRPLVLVLLLAAGAFISFRRHVAHTESKPVVGRVAKVLVIAASIGAYDGFFGPGTGTFLIIAFVAWLHSTVPRATADAKVVNFASNLATVVLMAARHKVLWGIALPMAAGQFTGGLVGASLAIKGGEKIIRRVVLGVVIALVLKLTVDLLR